MNTLFSILGATRTILRKKNKRNVRKVPNLGNTDDNIYVYWIDGMGVGAGYTMVIRVDPNNG